MPTYDVPVTLRITATDPEQAIASAASTLRDAFEDFDEFEEVVDPWDLPYLHKHDWCVHANQIREVSRVVPD